MCKKEYLPLGIILISIMTVALLFQSDVLAQTEIKDFQGFAGYVTSEEELNNTLAIMSSQNLSFYRISFRPSWKSADGTVRGYNPELIESVVTNTNFSVIVDGNHLYPASEKSAQDARSHWEQIKIRNFQILESFPNNSRVAIELINEYTSNDYDVRIQLLINEIRNAGYTNPIVANKYDTAWYKFNDPLNNTFQGMHFYFNTWSSHGALKQMESAQSIGIDKIINTEVGASSDEYQDFSFINVNELKGFLSQCITLGVQNCLWMNNDSLNWPSYTKIFSPQKLHTPANPTPTITVQSTPKPTQKPIGTIAPTITPTTSIPADDNNSITKENIALQDSNIIDVVIIASIVIIFSLSVFAITKIKYRIKKAVF